ncbi:hypothetical protein EXIGLDRAFT_749433 [Exidia glandulosa HHB12029]|uniref:DRBM domain-containing protein n=1 Tax=Exidia glandulosa HHB12029 TaxID=1314781 RepID=A0A165I3Y5_EXIGL|nr:hypothetical protein EXIGLDRAFT_749433 [Exidia glandulosa HHB12029]
MSYFPNYSQQSSNASGFAQNRNARPPSNSNPPSRGSTSQISNCVQMLNNHYQSKGLPPTQYVVYSQVIPLGHDQFAISVFLRDYSPPARFDGNGVGKHNAKESAARKALQALGVI